jgi:hypothetical protein
MRGAFQHADPTDPGKTKMNPMPNIFTAKPRTITSHLVPRTSYRHGVAVSRAFQHVNPIDPGKTKMNPHAPYLHGEATNHNLVPRTPYLVPHGEAVTQARQK